MLSVLCFLFLFSRTSICVCVFVLWVRADWSEVGVKSAHALWLS